ncbi:MAG: peptidylprolyl isomerase [Gammaproteobacteria bacterium]
MSLKFGRAVAALWVLISLTPAWGQASRTNVTIHTSLGDVPVELLGDRAPKTVENFLAYADAGDYACTVIHRLAFTSVDGRSVPFVVQGGGFTVTGTEFANMSAAHIPTRTPVVNEFGESNVRATLAMAKLGGNPDSATSEWFVNLGDNSGNLDNQNGGLTVFGRVGRAGMTVIDRIVALPRFSVTGLSPAFGDMPLRGIDPNAPVLRQSSFVRVNGVSRNGVLQSVQVPNLLGLPVERASQQLTNGSLILESIRPVLSSTVQEGAVVSQSIGAGERVGACASVEVSLSGIAVPSLGGLTQAEANAALQNAGLTTGAVTRAFSSAIGKGRVISQVPSSGAAVLRRTPVAYVLSDGPDPISILPVIINTLLDD